MHPPLAHLAMQAWPSLRRHMLAEPSWQVGVARTASMASILPSCPPPSTPSTAARGWPTSLHGQLTRHSAPTRLVIIIYNGATAQASYGHAGSTWGLWSGPAAAPAGQALPSLPLCWALLAASASF